MAALGAGDLDAAGRLRRNWRRRGRLHRWWRGDGRDDVRARGASCGSGSRRGCGLRRPRLLDALWRSVRGKRLRRVARSRKLSTTTEAELVVVLIVLAALVARDQRASAEIMLGAGRASAWRQAAGRYFALRPSGLSTPPSRNQARRRPLGPGFRGSAVPVVPEGHRARGGPASPLIEGLRLRRGPAPGRQSGRRGRGTRWTHGESAASASRSRSARASLPTRSPRARTARCASGSL